MDKNKTCYLFFDFDGTVTADVPRTMPDGTTEVVRILPESHVDSIRAAHEAGHKIFLCTGRSKGSLFASRPTYPDAFDLPWNGMICGASEMWYEGEQISVTFISREECFLWFEYCKSTKRRLHYNGSEKSVMYDFKSEPSDEKIGEMRADVEHQLKTNPLTNLSTRPAATDMDPKDTALSMIHLPTYSDIYAPNCDKGKAILKYCEMIGAPIEQTVCFGDSENDKEMFRVCDTRVAMKKAPESVKSLATYVAQSDCGVSEAIKHIFGI